MPEVNVNSNLYRDHQIGDPVIDPLVKAGRPLYATGTVANAATDEINSTYRLCDLPSDCMLHEDTRFDVENWGFANVRIGTRTDIDALVSVARSAGTTVQPVQFGDANHGLRLWEILGLAEDPGGFITLYAHAPANATGAGAMPFQVVSLQN